MMDEAFHLSIGRSAVGVAWILYQISEGDIHLFGLRGRALKAFESRYFITQIELLVLVHAIIKICAWSNEGKS